MRVLVTGAAGYIGSHAVRLLLETGAKRITGVDSMVTGHPGAVRVLEELGKNRFQFRQMDIRDTPDLTRLLRDESPDAVLHFAGLSQVGESMADPATYWSANAGGTASLLVAMRAAGVPRLVFSSTAAVYGRPPKLPIPETAPLVPINPYGHSKLACETMIRDEVDAAVRAGRSFGAAVLRYFNVAGASKDALLGEDHRPETHLIPGALRACMGLRPALEIYGTDYRTMDGTCIRDFVHVVDLVDAHRHMLRLLRDGDFRVCNVGIGRGYSVRQVLEICARVTGRTIPTVEHPRRAGDPPALVADSSLIRRELAWHPRFASLEPMVASAWEWMQKHPEGYPA